MVNHLHKPSNGQVQRVKSFNGRSSTATGTPVRNLGHTSKVTPFDDGEEKDSAADPNEWGIAWRHEEKVFGTTLEKGKGKILWRRLRNYVRDDAVLKADIRVHQSLFGQHMSVPDDITDPQKIKEVIAALKARRWVIMPENPKRMYWDFVQLFLLIYIAWAVPVRVGFSVRSKGVWFALDVLIDLYFLCDIGVNLCSAYVDEADYRLVTEPGKIMKHYLRTWFLLDVVALLPVDYVSLFVENQFECMLMRPNSCDSSNSSSAGYLKMIRMLRLIKLMKLLRLFKMTSLFSRYQDDLFELLQIIGLVRIVSVMVFMAHMLGCMWYFFADEDWYSEEEKQDEDLRPWMVAEFGEDYESRSLDLRYMAAVYWAFTTMTTVGYGDITARSTAERIWASFAMLLGTFSFSWICGSILQELETHYMQQMAYNQKMVGVFTYVKDMRLDRATRNRVLGYFRTQDIKSYDEKQLLFELPFELRTSILSTMYSDLIESVPLFVTRDKILITELCSRMLPTSLGKGSFVYRWGEAANVVYIISKGEVEVTDSQGAKIVAVFGKGSYFGEGCCFGERRRKHSIRCRSGVTLLTLSNFEMTEVLDMFPSVAVQMRNVCLARNRHFHKLQAMEEDQHKAPHRKSMLFATVQEDDAMQQEEHPELELPRLSKAPSFQTSTSFGKHMTREDSHKEATTAVEQKAEGSGAEEGDVVAMVRAQQAVIAELQEEALTQRELQARAAQQVQGDLAVLNAVVGAMDARIQEVEKGMAALAVDQASEFQQLRSMLDHITTHLAVK